MAGFSNYQRDRVGDSVFRGVAYSADATLYAALCTGAIDADDTGATMPETTYTAYARVAIVVNTSNWATFDDGLSENNNAITFPQCTGNAETITHVALLDASAAGNVVAYGALDSSVEIGVGDTPEFAAGDLDLQLT